MNTETRAQLEQLLNRRISHATPLAGGQMAAVYAVTLEPPLAGTAQTLSETASGTVSNTASGTVQTMKQVSEKVVVKVDSEGDLACEGRMLQYLQDKSHLPVPQVYAQAEGLLVLEHLPGTSVVNADEHHTTKQHTAEHQTTEHHTAEQHAAELLAGLHDVTAAAYGFAEDTLIGSLRLPNGWHPDWGQFFADKRLLHFANLAHERGRLPEKTLARIRQLAKQVPSWLEPNPPGLVHGDVWSGNVLAENGLISGILDPALYYADPEVELAYIDLFSTFGNAFWQHYQAHRPISDAFWQYRRALYSLYPLLVHVYYFGSGYLSGVEQRLEVLEQHIG